VLRYATCCCRLASLPAVSGVGIVYAYRSQISCCCGLLLLCTLSWLLGLEHQDFIPLYFICLCWWVCVSAALV
jgi:hypothetical protein